MKLMKHRRSLLLLLLSQTPKILPILAVVLTLSSLGVHAQVPGGPGVADAMRSLLALLSKQQPVIWTEVDTMITGTTEHHPFHVEIVDVATDPSKCSIRWTRRDTNSRGKQNITWTIDASKLQKYYIMPQPTDPDTSRGESSEANQPVVYVMFLNGAPTFSVEHYAYSYKKDNIPPDKTLGSAYIDVPSEEVGNQLADAFTKVATACGATVTSGSKTLAAAAAGTGPTVVAPPPNPGQGPSLQQTIDFINASFAKEGEFDFDNGRDKGVHVRYVGMYGWIEHKKKIHQQNVATSGANLTYSYTGTDITIDSSAVMDKHGDIAKGGDRLNKPVTSEQPITNYVTVPLDKVDPQGVSVVSQTVSECWSLDEDSPCDTAKTTPETFNVVLITDSSTRKGTKESVVVGTFFDKDLADHVAKAYIHAVVMFHKFDAPGLF